MKYLKKFKLFESEESNDKEITLHFDWIDFECILSEKDGKKFLKKKDGTNFEREFTSHRFEDLDEVFSKYGKRFNHRDNESNANCQKTGLTVLGSTETVHDVQVADGKIDTSSPDIKFSIALADFYGQDSYEGFCEINIHSINQAIAHEKLKLVKDDDDDDDNYYSIEVVE